MIKKRKKTRQSVELNTSSLPDIMFAILFFFIAIGMVKPPIPKVELTPVVLEGGVDLDDTSRYIHVQIGLKSGELVAQVGYDTFVPFSELAETLEDIRKEEPKRNIVLLYIDEDTGMGYIKNEIEPAILESGITNINYVLEDEEEV